LTTRSPSGILANREGFVGFFPVARAVTSEKGGRMMRRFVCSALLGSAFLCAPAARGQSVPLNDVLELTKGSTNFHIRFTDDVESTHQDYFPLNKAQEVRNAVDLAYDVFTQAPFGFTTPWVNSLPDFNISIFDSSNLGGANQHGITIDAPTIKTGTECALRGVVLHELFHTVQFRYLYDTSYSIRWAYESTARISEDKTFADLDGGTCTITSMVDGTTEMAWPTDVAVVNDSSTRLESSPGQTRFQ